MGLQWSKIQIHKPGFLKWSLASINYLFIVI
jgi:hypothetical protein